MAIQNTSTPAQYALILLDLARQRGVAPEQLLEGTGVTESALAKLGARIPEEVFSQVVERAYALTGDRALGLHLGKRLNLSAHATVGQAFMTCENLEQVLNFFLKYYRILAPTLELSYRQNEGRCWLTAHTPWEEERQEFSYELLFAAFVHSINLLLNNSALEYRVEFPYPEPDYVDEYHELFGDDLYFSAREARISMPEQWLEAELPSSNPALLALYEQECRRLLADLQEDGSLTEQTLQLLRKLEGHYPQMPQVADMLSMSPRTYRRRLAGEDTSFQQLLDQVRTEHAVHYLRTTRLPLASIAFMVGFNDVSNFRRAFIKWTGHTPRQARENALDSA
ncbi:MAG: AraC family transcriptional regulator [Halieaceae bacterium]|jgi:AraC-like DNA-binding protein|nr:AraC family transcriptional regulator [Halieaceae bacterium]